MNHPYVRKILLLILFSFQFSFPVNAQQPASSEEELKKQAEKAFVADRFEDALSPYSQLLSLYPRNATYNYRYGVALLKAGKNKTNAVSYLEAASLDPANPEEVWIYLGQSYMVIGKFEDALTSFKKFDGVANAAKVKKFNSEELKANCINAIELLRSRKNITIVSSKEVAANEFYKFFSWTGANGKLVPAAEQFLTSMDKDKQLSPVMFIANDKQTIYLSSYGKKGERGKDLYVIRKMPNGNWSEPENLGETINSTGHEDYPYLDRDGRTLYFSSKSDKSIGGYDIFKSKFDFNTGKWSTPENLGWPINTISDDYLYVPIAGSPEAYYATGINTSKNEIEIRRIQLPDQGEALVTIAGYYAPTDQKVRRDARITVLRGDGQGIVTSVYTDPYTGKYEVTLEPGQEYTIVVEGGGYLPHSENFSLPSNLSNSDLKQVVKVTREKSNENLTIENYFYPAAAVRDVPSEVLTATYDSNPDSSSMMAVQINNETVMVTKPGAGKDENELAKETTPEKDQLNIAKKDEYDPTLETGPTADEIRQKKEEELRTKEIVEENKKPGNYDITIGNEELANIAIMDAKSARQEADSLLLEVERLKEGAIVRDSLSAKAMINAEGASEQDKPFYLNEAYTMKADADNMRRQAADLSVAAMAKDSEAKSSEEEAGQLLATINDGKGIKGSKPIAKNTNKDTEVASKDEVKNNTTEKAPAQVQDNEIKELSPSETPVAKSNSDSSDKTSETNDSSLAVNSSDQTSGTEGKNNSDSGTTTENNTGKNSDTGEEKKSVAVENQGNDVSDKSGENGDSGDVTNKNSGNQIASGGKVPQNTNEPAKKINGQENSSGTASENKKSDDVVSHENTEPDKKSGSEIAKSKVSDSIPSDKNGNGETGKDPVASGLQKEENGQEITSDSFLALTSESDETISSRSGETAPIISGEISDSAQTSSTENTTVTNEQKVAEDVNRSTEPGLNNAQVNPDGTSGETLSSTESKTKDADAVNENGEIAEKKNSDKEIKNDPQTTKIAEQNTSGKIAINESDRNKSVADQNSENERNPDTIAENNTGSENIPSGKEENTETGYVSSVELKPAFLILSEEPKPFPADINTQKLNPVSEEARIAYQAYKTNYRNAKSLSDQSVELQNRIGNMKPSPEKDSLIFISNEFTNQSSAMYDESMAQLKAARDIDPEVKQKMELNEQIIAYNSSMPTNNVNNTGSPAINPADNKTDNKTENSTENSATVAKENPSTESVPSDTLDPVVNEQTENSLATAEKVADENSTVANEYALTPEEAKAVDEATTFTVETPNGKEVVKIDTTGINTRHPEFQKYVEVNKEITGKQVETIDVFAAAVNQQKIAVEQKQEQNRLMDLAEVEQDRPAKAQIFIKADAYRDSSKQNEKEAAEKFALAQNKTSEVKSKTAEMQEIRKRIAIPGRDLPQQATNSKVNPKGVTQEEFIALSEKNEISKQVSSQSQVTTPAKAVAPVTTYTPEKVQEFAKQSFSISTAAVYSKENPIPMNPPIPDGLVFKVQIGAFRNELPAEKFSGVQPITAETTRPGWVRYCVGLFQTFEPAVVVKKEMQQRGFKDAFVVAYLNGKRIGLDEAYAMIGKGKSKPDNAYVTSSQTEMALLRANNIRPENISSIRNNVVDSDEKIFYGENASNVKKSMAVVEYAVQVGVYRSQITPRALATLTPLFTEKIRNNLYRFTSDHYISYASADSMRSIARRAGVKDAFIVVYRNGVQSALASVPLAERKVLNTSASSSQISSAIPAENKTGTVSPSASAVPVNRTESSEEIIYRVQLGAFKNNIPFTAVVSFLNVADKGITQQTDDRGLHIFYAGTCNKFSEAASLKEEIVAKGVGDAFVVALQGGKRIALTDEMKAR